MPGAARPVRRGPGRPRRPVRVPFRPVRRVAAGAAPRALYGCERRAEALNVYQEMRVRLRDEVGVDPGEGAGTSRPAAVPSGR
ncbi:BTAD domain-containing putative transcriptional regulator [Streptomyces sp. NPDC090798]|uniref:BTAD domain-containing putative transcriptional regulator n=1 Tax=Streptomyces sp. NPDC090798 TaxID=3365968 RepID=UPI003823074E